METASGIFPHKVGVGLRHAHYEAALTSAAHIDFVEVHAENFYMEGGASIAVLERARELYDLSLHCTALGLGSAVGVSRRAVAKLAVLVERFDPLLVSDHLCFCWVDIDGRRVHAGDLLPVQRNRASLDVLVDNIDQVQQAIGRPLLLENVSRYVGDPDQQYGEAEFLSRLAERSGCQLLVDINNLLVNAHNLGIEDPVRYALAWLVQLPAAAVRELHLAGYTPTPPGELAVDDHGAPVTAQAWEVYAHALGRLGPVATLVEWDTRLPTWSRLLQEADTARGIVPAATEAA